MRIALGKDDEVAFPQRDWFLADDIAPTSAAGDQVVFDDALGAKRQAALEADLIALLRQSHHGRPDGLVVPPEYLETVITK